MTSHAKKVCLVSISLGRGGAERSTAMLSAMLHSLGYDVHLVILNDVIDYDFAGTLFNLGIDKTGNDTFLKRLARFKKLRTYFRKEKFDLIIDNRNRSSASKELYYLKYLYKNQTIIYVARSFKLENYFPKNAIVAKAMIKKSKAIVGVSKAIARRINKAYETDKAICIYNPVAVVQPSEYEADSNYILWSGRLVDAVKNVSLLLEAYSQSDLIKNKVQLKIYGDGPDKGILVRRTKQLRIDHCVDFYPFTPAISDVVEGAKYVVLTSHYEGFPRAIIEALALGTPAISVDCESGPSEIIQSGNNGLLVDNYDVDALTTAMNRFIFDKKLYALCKSNASASVAHLDAAAIAKDWQLLIEKHT